MNHTNNALYRQRSVTYMPSDAHYTFPRWAFMFASPDRRIQTILGGIKRVKPVCEWIEPQSQNGHGRTDESSVIKFYQTPALFASKMQIIK